jgi:hypothetical protein
VFDHPDPKKPTYGVNTSHEDFVPAYVSPNDQKLSSEQMGKLKQKIPALAKKPSAQENRQKSEALRNEFHEQAKKLIDDMIKTCQEDHQTIIDQSGPAIARIKLIQEMNMLLMKKPIQAEFLDFNGLEALAFWIDSNPDGSFPLP